MNILILPGLNGSGPGHWQTLWEIKNYTFRRVEEPDWAKPDRDMWVNNLEAAVRSCGPETFLVAHSLACHQVAHWASRTSLKIKGAFLVAPPNLNRPDSPKEVFVFRPMSEIRLSFKSILVVSSNDPYADIDFSKDCARIWGSRFVNAGALGHINALSNIGDWPEGYALFNDFINEPHQYKF